jgi:hypothetical protein
MSRTKFTAAQARAERNNLPDQYDLANLTWDMLVQHLEQIAPHTDFLYVKTVYDDFEKQDLFIERLEADGYYAKLTFNSDAGNAVPWAAHYHDKDMYLLIRWTDIPTDKVHAPQ